MSPARKELILTSLRAGNLIHRHWVGGNSGYLQHSLTGVSKLRESEIDQLRPAYLIPVSVSNVRYKPFKLREDIP